MNDDFDLIRANVEEPVRFDNFETFVHHGGGIDGDAIAHAPVGMREGLLRRDARELRKGSPAKRPAGSGENKAAHFAVRTAAQALMQRVVLAVYGKKLARGFFGGGHYQFAGGDENFFVGKRDGLSELDRFVGCFEADDANRRGDYDFRFRVRADGQHAFAAVMNFRFARDGLFAQQLRKLIGPPRVRYGHDFGLMACNLAEQIFEIGARTQRHHAKPAGLRFHHGKALAANRTRRAQNRKLLHKVSASLFENLESLPAPVYERGE